ncbi:hypothetical protein BST97_07380 [Nonlabens spongiae]|uniref:Uncharacterized protein n=1 Tax=Nonlabens spongiae TaxID=331648 RepID=A0A1W6MJT8_9FLAO|nr:hypothetical protein BST97_07380 [Nonlabens spongiae]
MGERVNLILRSRSATPRQRGGWYNFQHPERSNPFRLATSRQAFFPSSEGKGFYLSADTLISFTVRKYLISKVKKASPIVEGRQVGDEADKVC